MERYYDFGRRPKVMLRPYPSPLFGAHLVPQQLIKSVLAMFTLSLFLWMHIRSLITEAAATAWKARAKFTGGSVLLMQPIDKKDIGRPDAFL